ncbi:MAG TPA: biotin transporter BioY [Longimicrobiales bacterium]|nr:biotin transporter BioY [Longimicrobiales bacterium]
MSQVMVQIRRAAGTEVLTNAPARRVFAVVSFTLLTAFSAHVAVPVPGSMVPISMQTLMVILSGLLLGPALGASAQALYLGIGAMGAPVFVAGMGIPYLFGPTGGYLLAFPAAAAVAGGVAAAARGSTLQRTATIVLAAALASATVYAGGWAQLSLLSGDPGTAFRLGVLPFLLGDAAKIAVAVVLTNRLRRRALALL